MSTSGENLINTLSRLEDLSNELVRGFQMFACCAADFRQELLEAEAWQMNDWRDYEEGERIAKALSGHGAR